MSDFLLGIIKNISLISLFSSYLLIIFSLLNLLKHSNSSSSLGCMYKGMPNFYAASVWTPSLWGCFAVVDFLHGFLSFAGFCTRLLFLYCLQITQKVWPNFHLAHLLLPFNYFFRYYLDAPYLMASFWRRWVNSYLFYHPCLAGWNKNLELCLLGKWFHLHVKFWRFILKYFKILCFLLSTWLCSTLSKGRNFLDFIIAHRKALSLLFWWCYEHCWNLFLILK